MSILPIALCASPTCQQGLWSIVRKRRSQHKNKEKAMRLLKAKMAEVELEKKQKEISSSRASQVGSGDRSERIRTYNYSQNRVTDHRINLTQYNLDQVMEGALVTHRKCPCRPLSSRTVASLKIMRTHPRSFRAFRSSICKIAAYKMRAARPKISFPMRSVQAACSSTSSMKVRSRRVKLGRIRERL